MRRLRTGALLALTIGALASHEALAERKVNLYRGQQVFDGLCNRCHGMEGEGNDAKNIKAPAIAGMPAWYVEDQLEKFRTGKRGKHPLDNPGMRMYPIARTLFKDEQRDDLADVSAYVEKLPKKTAPATLDGADIEKGKAKYGMCIACHGANGEGNPGMKAPALAGQSDWYLFTQLKNIKAGIRKVPMMAGVTPGLDEEAMRNLAAYLHSLPSK